MAHYFQTSICFWKGSLQYIASAVSCTVTLDHSLQFLIETDPCKRRLLSGNLFSDAFLSSAFGHFTVLDTRTVQWNYRVRVVGPMWKQPKRTNEQLQFSGYVDFEVFVFRIADCDKTILASAVSFAGETKFIPTNHFIQWTLTITNKKIGQKSGSDRNFEHIFKNVKEDSSEAKRFQQVWNLSGSSNSIWNCGKGSKRIAQDQTRRD